MAPFGLETVLMALDEEVAANAENQRCATWSVQALDRECHR
jgi:hypothetical protein